MGLARAPRRARLTARKKGSGYENGARRESPSLLAGRCQAEAARKGLRPLLVKSRFMRTERTQNSHWSEVPHELISCKYLTRTTFRNVILKLAFNQWRIKP